MEMYAIYFEYLKRHHSLRHIDSPIIPLFARWSLQLKMIQQFSTKIYKNDPNFRPIHSIKVQKLEYSIYMYPSMDKFPGLGWGVGEQESLPCMVVQDTNNI